MQHAFSLMALEKCLGSPFLRGTARSIAVGALISPSITFSFLLHSTATAAAAVGALPVVPSWLLQLWCELEALAGHGHAGARVHSHQHDGGSRGTRRPRTQRQRVTHSPATDTTAVRSRRARIVTTDVATVTGVGA